MLFTISNFVESLSNGEVFLLQKVLSDTVSHRYQPQLLFQKANHFEDNLELKGLMAVIIVRKSAIFTDSSERGVSGGQEYLAELFQ